MNVSFGDGTVRCGSVVYDDLNWHREDRWVSE